MLALVSGLNCSFQIPLLRFLEKNLRSEWELSRDVKHKTKALGKIGSWAQYGRNQSNGEPETRTISPWFCTLII